MAGVMKSLNLSFSEFTAAYAELEKREEFLSATPNQSEYGSSLASVWALEHLEVQAMALLNTLSMLHPDGISGQLYIKSIGKLDVTPPGFPKSLSEYKEAHERLQQCSLIQRTGIQGAISIHRLVQDVARMRLTKEGFRQNFLTCVQITSMVWPFDHFPSRRQGVGRWPMCEEIFPHVLRLKDLAKSTVPSRYDFTGDFEFVKLLADAARYRHERGRSNESKILSDFAQEICMVWETRLLLIDTPDEETLNNLKKVRAAVAEILHNRGCTSTEINEPEDAYASFKQFNLMMMEEFQRNDLLNSTDKRLAISWNELGNAYMLKNNWKRGEWCFLRAIDTMKKLENYVEIDISLPLVNLGLAYWIQGRHSEALATLKKGLQDRDDALGSNDRKLFTRGRYLHALGNVLEGMGEHEASRIHHREALSHYKVTLGLNHHRTADAFIKVTEHLTRLNQNPTAL
jgi:tetratricopeptide (TPR) repeat protein